MRPLARFCIRIHLYTIINIIKDMIITLGLTAMACVCGASIICGGINMLRWPHLMNGSLTAPLGAFGTILDIILFFATIVSIIIGIGIFWRHLKLTIREEKQDV